MGLSLARVEERGRKYVAEASPKLLEGVDLLSGLNAAEVAILEEYCRYKKFAAGEQIFDRQSKTTDVFFVVRGSVRIVNYSLSGREITLDDIGHGGHFGELAAIDGQPRSASVMALSDCVIVSMPQKVFMEALVKFPPLALKVMRHLAGIVRRSTDRIMDLSTLGANNRVHAELLRQAKANGADTNEAIIKPIPVHSDLASRVSTTRETVARVLNDLARQGIVERRKDHLVIHDVARLQNMVDQVQGDKPVARVALGAAQRFTS